MRRDRLSRRLHIARLTHHLEDGPVPAGGRRDVGVGVLLDPLDGGALLSDYETHELIRHFDLDGDITVALGRTEGGGGAARVLATSLAQLAEVFGRRQDLLLRERHVLLPACNTRTQTSETARETGGVWTSKPPGYCIGKLDKAAPGAGNGDWKSGRWKSTPKLG